MSVACSKSFDRPDETRSFPDGEAAVVDLGDVKLGMGRLHPGWSFERSMKPLVGGDSCQLRHVGFAFSGRLVVTMNDGSDMTIGPGEAYIIPAGHQAAVDGEEDFVALEFDATALAEFGKA